MALNINGTTGISGVEGSVSAPVLTGTDSNCGISFPAADTIKFSTGGVERLAITNSGLSGDGSGLTGIGGGGKFLQIVGSIYTSNITIITSSTYQDTGLTCNITTSASGHAGVLVLVNGALGGNSNTSGGEGVAQMNLVRGSTQLTEVVRGCWGGNVSGAVTDTYGATPMNFYDTGTSASTTYTYKVQFRMTSNTSSATWNKYNGESTIYLIEVGS
jgi:hypothetical protein